MKVSAPTAVRLAMMFMVFVIFLVPAPFVIVPIVAQIALVVAAMFLRRRPKQPAFVDETYGPINPR